MIIDSDRGQIREGEDGRRKVTAVIVLLVSRTLFNLPSLKGKISFIRPPEKRQKEEREERRIMLFRVSIKRSFPGETLVAFYGRRRSIV